jgi:HD-like signal output (HDOD) protein
MLSRLHRSPAAPEATGTSPLDAALRHVSEISTLPQVALRVMEVAQDPKAGAAMLKAVVEGDPALSARVLRLVNSAAYAVRTPVTNLQQAISFLGFNQVRNLALTASVSDIFRGDQKIGPYSRTGLWRHLVAVGLAARLVARRQRLGNFEDAFLAGLLHDIGIILIDQHLHEQFAKVIAGLKGDKPLCDVEREVLGFDHCQFGERIAETWRFPLVTRGAIRHHHHSGSYHGPEAAIVICVEIANVLCTMKGMPSVGLKCVRPAGQAFQAFGLGKEDVLVLSSDLDAELARSESLFEL